jgi:hypothetical protein
MFVRMRILEGGVKKKDAFSIKEPGLFFSLKNPKIVHARQQKRNEDWYDTTAEVTSTK